MYLQGCWSKSDASHQDALPIAKLLLHALEAAGCRTAIEKARVTAGARTRSLRFGSSLLNTGSQIIAFLLHNGKLCLCFFQTFGKQRNLVIGLIQGISVFLRLLGVLQLRGKQVTGLRLVAGMSRHRVLWLRSALRA